MIKKFFYIIIFLFFSCTNLFIEENLFNSIGFSGSAWIEFGKLSSMQISQEANDFTIQFWASGKDINTSEAPAFFSLYDDQNNIKLALYRDRGGNNYLTTIANSNIYRSNSLNVDWTNSDNFYLITIFFSSDKNLEGYINDLQFLNVQENINIGNSSLIVGASANEELTIMKNHWYGYFDEIRLWNTRIADTTRLLHIQYPYKLSDYYLQTYLDSLIGLWRFNFSDASFTVTDDSGNNNDGDIWTKDGALFELSDKGVQ